MRSKLFLQIVFTLFLCLSHSSWAWKPSHRIQTKAGQIYLRQLSETSLLFAYRPGDSKISDIPDSPAWSTGIQNSSQAGNNIQELSLGQSLKLSKTSSLYVFRAPVGGELALEIRQTGTERRAQSLRLDFRRGDANFSRVLKIRSPQTDHLLGLGEHLKKVQDTRGNGDLMGQIRYSGANLSSWKSDAKGVYGNMMVPLQGGNVGNALINSLLMLDDQGPDILLFLDNPADTRWNFQSSPWFVGVRHGELQGAIAWGQEAPALRREFLSWTGRPPVPPRKAFGLWVSEYGYENWAELESLAKGLKESGFPVDGFVLDLQWFGGIKENSGDSKMGGLNWDTSNFPDPAKKIAELALRGIGIIVIEESYISKNLPEFTDLAQKKFLVASPEDESKPHIINENPWWGIGSMFDYTNPQAASYWHKLKREPLRKMGVLGHWTDLGEPEIFRNKAMNSRKETNYSTPIYYQGKGQLEVNNLFGFRWAQSIFNGYGEDGHSTGPRPFILARTATAGIQRFGTSLWSGDIGANWESLRSHYQAQSHVSASGIDYFGSDVGGFYRDAFKGNSEEYKELYSRWFAAACLTDIPLRPHTMNLGNKYQTSPHLVGDRASNLANLKQRYRLIPYLYSQAHLAWQNGNPLVSGTALFAKTQAEFDRSINHKHIGKDLLARLILSPQAKDSTVHFPSGDWYDFETAELMTANSKRSARVATLRADLMRTPLYARAGSLVPLGSAESSQSDPEILEIKIFPDIKTGSGFLIEDDGLSEAFRAGSFAKTEFSQIAWRKRYGQVTVGARTGPYSKELPPDRDIIIHLASTAKNLKAYLNEQEVPMIRQNGFWVAHIGSTSASQEITIDFR